MTPEMIAILAVGAALAGLVWQSQRGLRADLSAGLRDAKEDRERLRAEGRDDRERLRAELAAGLREAKEDRERLRADMNSRMDRLDGRMDGIEGRMERMETRMDGIEGRFDGIHARFDSIHSVIREQGERLSRIEGMLHLHLGRNEDPAPPLAPAE